MPEQPSEEYRPRPLIIRSLQIGGLALEAAVVTDAVPENWKGLAIVAGGVAIATGFIISRPSD
jgi:hypothetical protein